MCNRSIVIATLAAAVAAVGAAPAFAGMQEDLADCPNPNRPESAAACSRILASGRLPQSQLYIAYFNRGWAYRQAGDAARARADFDTVLKLNPRYAWGYYSRALIERDRGAEDKAKADLDKALAIDAGFVAANALMGRLLEARGDIAGARAHYQRALAAEPKGLDARSSQATARERVEALKGLVGASAPATGSGVHVLSSGEKSRPAPETSNAPGLDCRRFIPSAGTTISVDCAK
jgi:tetratricopeptide (TPR) repeat protein